MRIDQVIDRAWCTTFFETQCCHKLTELAEKVLKAG